MQKLFFAFILLLNYLLIKSQSYMNHPKKLDLVFQYYPGKPSKIIPIPTLAHTVPKNQADSAYNLTGELLNRNTLNILAVNRLIYRCSNIANCESKSPSSYIILQDLLNEVKYIIKLDDKNAQIKKILNNLSLQGSIKSNQTNLTCSLSYDIDKPKDFHHYYLTNTGLFGIIFLSSCVALTFTLCIGWFAVIYCRRFEHQRMKSKLGKALARSVQQMLDKSPVIIYDSNNKDPDCTDEDPMCAICLESFIDNEKLRKLVCSHYFHMSCIDPWLLSHQSCPLCNRNILRNSIPSISSRIMPAMDERISRDSVSAHTQNDNLILETRH